MATEPLRIRVIAPDLWREKKTEYPPETSVSDIKREVLPDLVGNSEVDPEAYYVEYFEKEILDESKTLSDLDVPQNGVISLRPYDLDHPPPFHG
ncbi:MAG: hypothetical protein GWN99_10510 [Gemmatimonadetes bacterium]|uniref:Ubiquitin-like domain-containing protein n=1 Tax=Candidatus Kutchimonas denitrificans TaxID=3056748 RepID=A0AAE4Z8R5_9BACT|nr:hypothetical protein [Gemmatimonadota bacterium]NIR74727.1 hypothetical protein [Candidatus Kutchimonas denitrificans]NIS01477.1 hypothetical protein [Gemmatimonadota bacterium]NIT67218.1 hypothetical protein [Gemmatimonadota bacterium]NIU52392.1 hypothetical protein [Gemmatimonadota bacterium]